MRQVAQVQLAPAVRKRFRCLRRRTQNQIEVPRHRQQHRLVDFDPAMLEAQACGVPVIAFREGAALELVIDAEEGQQGTGLFFDELDIESLVSALEELERRPQRCSGPLGWSSAAAYSEAQFEKRTVRLVREVLHAEGIRTLDREIRSKTSRNQRRDAA